jgi:hypothetical protein
MREVDGLLVSRHKDVKDSGLSGCYDTIPLTVSPLGHHGRALGND